MIKVVIDLTTSGPIYQGQEVLYHEVYQEGSTQRLFIRDITWTMPNGWHESSLLRGERIIGELVSEIKWQDGETSVKVVPFEVVCRLRAVWFGQDENAAWSKERDSTAYSYKDFVYTTEDLLVGTRKYCGVG